MSRPTPPCPSASPSPRATSFLPFATLAIALTTLGPSGCYDGHPDTSPDGSPWQGADDESSGNGGDGNADDGANGSASSGADDGGTPPGDGGDPPDDGGDPPDDSGDPPDDSGDPPDDSGDPPDDSGGPPDADVPDIPYCDEVSNYDPAWRQLEEDILVLVNQYRASGADCGSEGSFGSAPPLTMDPALRCAARKHSKDMNDRMFFDHTNPSGESPWDRMGHAGYSYSAAGENIAGGSPDAAGTMDQWMNSDGHCSNIMSPNFEEIGVGYYPGGQWGHLWTQAFGSP